MLSHHHETKAGPAGALSRRSLLQAVAALPLAGQAATAVQPKLHVAVVGAGAFGGWTALALLRRGLRVTLFDAWGPGHSRASSGGETRVIRAIYGPDRVYVEMVQRAFQLWQENQARWKCVLYRPSGVLWLAGADDPYLKPSLPILRAAKLPYEELTPAEAGKRFPQVSFQDVQRVVFEKAAGYLEARQACAAVVEGFVKEGGTYRQLAVTPGAIRGPAMTGLGLSDGSTLVADRYVFACGPWLGKLFPQAVGDRVHPTRQEVFFFGAPAGDPRFTDERLPVWIDLGPREFYGIPGDGRRGFKLADDVRGPTFDPTSGDRVPTPAGLKAARSYLGFRFPALKDAPLVEARVCQYENSPDGHLILDRHPEAENVWLAGGGSGHGFKLGPAVGERVADLVLGEKPVERFFSLGRFTKPATPPKDKPAG